MKQLTFLLLFITHIAFGQSKAVTLEDCYRLARENYPRLEDLKRQQKMSTLRTENISKVWNPQIILNGQATYQSDVTSVNSPIPNIRFPIPNKDQYKAYADLKQTIYDGGASRSNKALELSSVATEIQNIEIELYALNDRINQLYFAVLLMKENEKILKLKQSLLSERIKVVASGFKNGVANLRDLETLKAESLLTDQQIQGVSSEKIALTGVLGILTGLEMNEQTIFLEPSLQIKKAEITRPELKLFELMGNKIDKSAELIQKARNPKVFGFGQAGYGRPGLNMLSTTFDPYWLIGVGISWNVTDWKQTARNREILGVQKELVNSQRLAFDQNLSMSLFKAGESVKKAEQLLKMDDDIVQLRTKIADQSASQLENGIITSADYITDLNAVTQANINKQSHHIELLQAITNYNTLKGNPISQ